MPDKQTNKHTHCVYIYRCGVKACLGGLVFYILKAHLETLCPKHIEQINIVCLNVCNFFNIYIFYIYIYINIQFNSCCKGEEKEEKGPMF